MIIEFSNWRVKPADALNSQLWHRHAATKGRDAGVVKWHATGRFYQYASMDRAVLYAAECDLMERQTPAPVGLMEFVAEYRAVLEEYTTRIEAAAREIRAARG